MIHPSDGQTDGRATAYRALIIIRGSARRELSYGEVGSLYPFYTVTFADKDLSSVTELFSDADDAFFERIMTNSEHVLQPFLREKPDLSYNLREHTHNRSLITKALDLTARLIF